MNSGDAFSFETFWKKRKEMQLLGDGEGSTPFMRGTGKITNDSLPNLCQVNRERIGWSGRSLLPLIL